MKALAAFLLLATYLFSYQVSELNPSDDRVSGTVIDEDRRPVSDATVYIVEQGLSIQDYEPAQVKTHSDGRFDFGEKLKHRAYELYARKEKEAYPDRLQALYQPADFKPQTVQLLGEHPKVAVDVKLGEKAGVLTGKVIDGETGVSLAASVTLINPERDAQHRIW